jgi:hypothetical protein
VAGRAKEIFTTFTKKNPSTPSRRQPRLQATGRQNSDRRQPDLHAARRQDYRQETFWATGRQDTGGGQLGYRLQGTEYKHEMAGI